MVSESGGSGVASESGAFCLLELRVFSTFLNILRSICSGPGYPTQRAGNTSCPRSERFWLLELRVSRTFLDQLRPPVFQAMDTQLGATSTAAPTIHRGRAQLSRAPAFVEVVATDDPAARQYHVHLIAYAPAPTSTPPKNRPYILPGLIEDPPIYRANPSGGPSQECEGREQGCPDRGKWRNRRDPGE